MPRRQRKLWQGLPVCFLTTAMGNTTTINTVSLFVFFWIFRLWLIAFSVGLVVNITGKARETVKAATSHHTSSAGSGLSAHHSTLWLGAIKHDAQRFIVQFPGQSRICPAFYKVFCISLMPESHGHGCHSCGLTEQCPHHMEERSVCCVGPETQFMGHC